MQTSFFSRYSRLPTALSWPCLRFLKTQRQRPSISRSTLTISLLYVPLPVHHFCYSSFCPGIPRKPFSTPIPPRLQDSRKSSRAPLAHVEPTAPPAVHPTPSTLRPHGPCIKHTAPPILTGHTNHRIRQNPAPLRTSGADPRHDRLPLLPPRAGPRRMAPPDRAHDQCGRRV